MIVGIVAKPPFYDSLEEYGRKSKLKYILKKVFEIVILTTIASAIGAALIWFVMTYILPKYIEQYLGG